MNAGKIFKKSLSSLLIAISLLGVLLGIASYAMQGDYSRPGTTLTSSIYASDVLEGQLGYTLTSAEKSYLDLYCDFRITHGAHISTSYVKTSYDENAQTLSVTVHEHSYVCENGAVIEWVPTKAILRGEEHALVKEQDGYKTVFTSVDEQSDNTVQIVFEYDFVISPQTLNTFINKAYYDAPAVKAEHERRVAEYEQKYREYQQNRLDYAAYLVALSEYESDYALYSEYLVQKRIYDEKYAEYTAYLEETADYKTAKVEYEKYLKALEKYNSDYALYLEYLANAAEYDAKMQAYNNYLAKLEIVNAQLKIIEDTKVNASALKRPLHGAIMGTTVTDVINNKDAIANEVVGADADAVDRAGIATENLRVLFTDYFACKSDAEKYSYYTLNYEKFRDNFAELLRTLDKLYLNDKVRGALIMQEKQEKYIVLLAQLYYVTNALSDTPVQNFDGTGYFDSRYYIGKGYRDQKKPSQVITETDYFVDTNNATPLSDGYPNPVEKPEELVVTEPVKPAVVTMPIEPTEVKKPTAPKVVNEPVRPIEVTELPEPEQYLPDSAILGLIEEYDAGRLAPRSEATSSVTVKREITVNKRFVGATEVTVVFHDHAGNEIYNTTVDKGTFAEFVGELPTKVEDARAVYTFAKWVDENGVEPDLSAVEGDLMLHPYFDEEIKKYPVTWVIDGQEISELVEYGQTPECKAPTVKSDSGDFYYEFSAWDKPISAVTGATTYTAVFNAKYVVPFALGQSGAAITVNEAETVADCKGTAASSIDISRLVDKYAGKTALKIITRYGDVSFSYSESIKLKESGVCSITLTVTRVGSGGYAYTVSLFDKNGVPCGTDARAEVILPCDIASMQGLVLYRIDGTQRTLTRFKAEQGSIAFAALAGKNYRATVEYGVTLIPCGPITINVDKLTATAGSVISVEAIAPKGVVINGIYYVDSTGQRTYIDGYLNLLDNVSIGVDYRYTEYTVTFVSDGRVISVATYRYGDMPVVPANPKKAADEEFSYDFLAWSPTVSAVTGDVTYTAEYMCNPIQQKDEPSGLQITDAVMRLLLLGASGVFVFLFAVIPCVVISIIFTVKHKKKLVDNCKKTDKL